MFFRLLISELRFRCWTAMLTMFITACAAVAVFFFMGLSDLMADRTRLIQRDLGLNLRIVPEGTDLDRYWMKGYADGTIDESLVERLEQQEVANRLVPMLQRTIPWGDGEAILTGIGDERFAGGQQMKPAFGRLTDQREQVVLGHLAAEKVVASEGDEITVLNRRFVVKRILAQEGSIEDLRIHLELSVVQELLELPGRLNEIRALECNCAEGITDPEEHLRSILEPLLPGTMMIRQDRMADARRKQRQLVDRLTSVGLPIVVILSVVIVAALIILNTYQRRRELGLFSLLGRGPTFVGGLIWGRAILLGCGGGLVGAGFAWWALSNYGGALVGNTSASSMLLFSNCVLGGVLGGAITSVASIFPIVLLLNAEPAIVLRGE
jgi:hypothetical protein